MVSVAVVHGRRGPGDLPVLVKVVAGSVVMLAVAVLVGVVALVKLDGSAGQSQTMYTDNVLPLIALGHLERQVMQARVDLLRHGLATDKATKANGAFVALNFTGTPTLVSATGKVIAGSGSLDDINKWLAENGGLKDGGAR